MVHLPLGGATTACPHTTTARCRTAETPLRRYVPSYSGMWMRSKGEAKQHQNPAWHVQVAQNAKGHVVMEVPACQEDAEGVREVEAPETWGHGPGSSVGGGRGDSVLRTARYTRICYHGQCESDPARAVTLDECLHKQHRPSRGHARLDTSSRLMEQFVWAPNFKVRIVVRHIHRRTQPV